METIIKKMTSALSNFVKSLCVALYKCGSTPGPISAETVKWSPLISLMASAICPVVATTTPSFSSSVAALCALHPKSNNDKPSTPKKNVSCFTSFYLYLFNNAFLQKLAPAHPKDHYRNPSPD